MPCLSLVAFLRSGIWPKRRKSLKLRLIPTGECEPVITLPVLKPGDGPLQLTLSARAPTYRIYRPDLEKYLSLMTGGRSAVLIWSRPRAGRSAGFVGYYLVIGLTSTLAKVVTFIPPQRSWS